jgi:hypothetical protein
MKANPARPRPSLDQQLRGANVSPGTKLEQLVRSNQDFDLLDPHESHNDRTGLPLWLRVYWRKNHPEHSYSPDDPTGGYPRALKNLRTWMVLNQDLPGVDVPAAAKGRKSTKK